MSKGAAGCAVPPDPTDLRDCQSQIYEKGLTGLRVEVLLPDSGDLSGGIDYSV